MSQQLVDYKQCVGFGTYKLIDNEAYYAVLAALKKGYRRIDNAKIYKNEEQVGKAIKQGISDGIIKREELCITTKISNKDQIKGRVRKAFMDSMSKLGLTYLDEVLLHHPIADKLEQSWKELTELYKEGLCKRIGVSNFEINDLKYFDTDSNLIKPMINQIELHPFYRRDALVEYCRLHNIMVVAHSSMVCGHKFDDKNILSIANNYKVSVAQILLKWGLQHGYIILPRAADENYISENICLSFEICDSDMKILDNLDEQYIVIKKREHIKP